MNYPDGANRGPARTLSSTHSRPEIARLDYTVFTKADCASAWKLFADWKRWPSFSDIYGRGGIRWQGDPWSPGSRLRIEMVIPEPTIVDRVITICTPPRCVAWINHVRGHSMEQWVLFDPYVGGGTRISTWIELTGQDLCGDGRDARQIGKRLLEKWFDKFCAECDRVADGR